MTTTQLDCQHVLRWLDAWRKRTDSRIERIPFEASRDWQFEADRRAFVHRSGRFFSVRGIRVGHLTTDRPGQPQYQPILDQPEKGILGFLAQIRDGELQLLLQAKPEPGNVGLYQIAPTVQATQSNYDRVHGGRPTPFLEYFTDPRPGTVLLHQLQSEQGTRFLKKRNRNMVVLLDPHEELELTDQFCWASLRHCKSLLMASNVMNTDSRSVLSCFEFSRLAPQDRPQNLLGERLAASANSTGGGCQVPTVEVLHWLNEAKLCNASEAEIVGLTEMLGWRIEDDEIRRDDGKLFSVIQIQAAMPGREVLNWDQPIISSCGTGLVGLICQMRRGILHFLIQVKSEPCHFDGVELTATVDCFPSNYDGDALSREQPFYDYLMESENVHINLEQTDEGSRFYRDNSRYRVVEMDEGEFVPDFPNYRWLTLAQILDLIRFNNIFTNQIRSLIAILRFGTFFC